MWWSLLAHRNPATGVVTGKITATDADADLLTYTVSQNPVRAQQLGFNSATGTFIYTPTGCGAPCRRQWRARLGHLHRHHH